MLLRFITCALVISARGGAPTAGGSQTALFTVGFRDSGSDEIRQVIPKGTRLPSRSIISGEFHGKFTDGAWKDDIEIFLGGHTHDRDNKFLGKLEFEVQEPVAAWERDLEVTANLDIDGVLTVYAVQVATGRMHMVTLRLQDHLAQMFANAAEACNATERRLAGLDVSELALFPSDLHRLGGDVRAKIADLRAMIAADSDSDDPRAVEVKTGELQSAARRFEEELWSSTARVAAALCSIADAHLEALEGSSSCHSSLVGHAMHDAGAIAQLVRGSFAATASNSSLSLVELQQKTEDMLTAAMKLDKLLHVLEYARALDGRMATADSCSAPAPAANGHGADLDAFVAVVGQRVAALRAKVAGGDQVEVETEVKRMTQDMVQIFQKLAVQAVSAAATLTAAT